MRKHSPLPEGYRVEEAVSLRLFDPQGKLVEDLGGSPNAASQVEARAWQDAWKRLESELREDLHALREGIRPLEDLRRLRQYMRMLDAVERAPLVAQEQAAHAKVVRRRALGGLALAAAAAAFAVFISTTPFGPVEDDQSSTAPSQTSVTSSVRQDRQTTTQSVANPAARTVAPRMGDPRTSSDAIRHARARIGRRPSFHASRLSGLSAGAPASARTPLSGYAVSFGEFATRATADGRMRLIRAKGYLVYVAQVGDSYLVVTRPYRTRAQADRLANALQEIGLPAMTQIAGTFLL